MNNLAVFVSGSGTNMENLIREIKAGKIPDTQINLIVCDNPEAKAIAKAESAGIDVALIERKKFASKPGFEAEIIKRLEAKKIEWIVLAGFMKILSCEFVRHYHGKIINIHPSLLPAFPGAHGIREAFEAKVKETGVTVHFVDEGIDTGPVILQKKIPVAPNETLESLEAKVHAVEYALYPEALRLVFSGNVRLPKHSADDWVKD
jgi:phosphoribosylglycinamide formyltransferase 1